jgi:hypothetical protein
MLSRAVLCWQQHCPCASQRLLCSCANSDRIMLRMVLQLGTGRTMQRTTQQLLQAQVRVRAQAELAHRVSLRFVELCCPI